jgi:hypothetical protein
MCEIEKEAALLHQSDSAVRPSAEWIGRAAARMLNMAPELSLLDAVRRAVVGFAVTGNLDPELAAIELIASDTARESGAGFPDDHAP